MTIDEFVTAQSVHIASTPADSNPQMASGEWAKNARHWHCVLTMGDRSLDLFYSMGSALAGPPSAVDVLDSLASDATTEGTTFEAWADDFGLDTDSRKALATFEAVQALTARLRAWLGDDRFAALVAAERL